MERYDRLITGRNSQTGEQVIQKDQNRIYVYSEREYKTPRYKYGDVMILQPGGGGGQKISYVL
jgi:hypothetical protein